MKTRLLLISSFLIISILSWAQLNPWKKRQMETLITEDHKEKGFIHYALQTCMEDSLFYKNDTITFYDNQDYFEHVINCCEFVGWEFIGEDVIRQHEPQVCLEPWNVDLSTVKYYTYSIKKQKKKLYLTLFQDKLPFEVYLIKNIEYFELPGEDKCRGITLIRLKAKG